MLLEMNLYIKRSYDDLGSVTEAQFITDKKLAKEHPNAVIEKRGSIKDNSFARRIELACGDTLSTSMSTRQNLEAVKRRIVAKDESTLSRRSTMDSTAATVILSQQTQQDTKLPEWPDENDSDHGMEIVTTIRTSDVYDKENLECLSPQFNGSAASGTFANDDEVEATENDRQKSWLKSYREKQAMGATSLLDESTESQPEEEEDERPSFDNTSRSLSKQDSMMSTSRSTSLLDTVMEDERFTPDESDTPRSLSGRMRSIASPVVSDGPSTSTVPWANIKLRSRPRPVAPQKEQDNIETAKSESSTALECHPESISAKRQSSPFASSLPQEDASSDVPPWTVKLRSVSRPRTSDASSDAGTDDGKQTDLSLFRKQLRKVPSELNAVKRKEKEELGGEKTPETKTLADLSWAPVSNQPVNLKPRKSNICGIVRGDDIDLTNLPADAFGSEKDIVIVELDRIPGMPEEHRLSVVVGKNMILEARTVEGVQLSRVNWRVPRADVKSLALDMADRRADIVLKGRKDKSLIFGSAEGCLRFANAFYETTKESSASTDDQTTATTVDESDSVSELGSVAPVSVAPEGLTEEEHQLLEAFRQKRKTKSSAEAMKESMAAVQSDWDAPAGSGTTENASSESFTQAALNDEEQKIASTYRKMLKFSVPAEAVRHKMTKDGVDEKIITAVLSDPSETPTPSPATLSTDEEKVAETYRKMLKMCIPPEAVRHRMTKDKVDSRIVDAVLGGSSPPQIKTEQPKQPSLSEEDEKLAASYRKMLKMMIPEEAVRHKMKKDQASNDVIVAVFGPEAVDAEQAKQEENNVLSAEEEAVAATYRKMLKMMIPPDAVRHKMKKEQVDSKIVIAVLGADPDEERASKTTENSLSEADEQIAETYRKILRMKVPPDGVRHKMTKNGVGEHIIKAVLGADIAKPKTKELAKAKKTAAHGSKLVSLHWTPLSGEALDNSVWRASKKRKMAVAHPEGSDISKLVELFQKKTNKRAASATDGAGNGEKGNDMAKLIDLNRANNLAISLKAFKDFSHAELADTIAHLDPLQRIIGERVQFMKDLLPTPTEVKVIKAYKGDESRLVAAELFFTKMVKVSRVQTKIQVMQTMDTLNDNAAELAKSFVLLETVCLQIMNSEKLEEVLDMVLQIGNIMNEGTRTGGAAGFKFDSLLKLTQTKSSDGKMTVLDYIVMIFVAKEKRETLQLTSDFPECQVAARMLITDMVNEVNNMNAALKKCETELENLKKDNGEIPVAAAVATDPRAALMAALKKKAAGGEEANKPKNFGKRDAFLAAIEARQTSEPTELDGKPINKPVQAEAPAKKDTFVAKDSSLKSGIQRLQTFISNAKDVLKGLEEERDRAIDACKSLSRYCGESGGERATSTLIGILSQFATNLESAVQKHDQRKEAEQRREAAAQKKKDQHFDTKPEAKPITFGKSAKKSSEPSTRGQSLVLMVNELLKNAPEDAKEDFKKGVVYIDPDDKLRAIYKKERESLGIFVPPDARKPSQVDLLIAIKKRRERADAMRESSVTSTSGAVTATSDAETSDELATTQGCNVGGCIS